MTLSSLAGASRCAASVAIDEERLNGRSTGTARFMRKEQRAATTRRALGRMEGSTPGAVAADFRC